MATIGLDELPADVQAVLKQGEPLESIDGGAVVAGSVPVTPLHSTRPGLQADLAALDELIQITGQEMYVYSNNDGASNVVRNAERLRELVGA